VVVEDVEDERYLTAGAAESCRVEKRRQDSRTAPRMAAVRWDSTMRTLKQGRGAGWMVEGGGDI
jgi:hypothetical protein